MKVFRCGDLVDGCPTRIEGESEDEILQRVAVHARDEHGMHEVPSEVEDRIREAISEA
jgi:predicted small metal-binding protein